MFEGLQDIHTRFLCHCFAISVYACVSTHVQASSVQRPQKDCDTHDVAFELSTTSKKKKKKKHTQVKNKDVHKQIETEDK